MLVTKTRQRLADLDYDFDALAELMREHELITVQLIWPESKRATTRATRLPAGRGRGSRRPAPPRQRLAATYASSA